MRLTHKVHLCNAELLSTTSSPGLPSLHFPPFPSRTEGAPGNYCLSRNRDGNAPNSFTSGSSLSTAFLQASPLTCSPSARSPPTGAPSRSALVPATEPESDSEPERLSPATEALSLSSDGGAVALAAGRSPYSLNTSSLDVLGERKTGSAPVPVLGNAMTSRIEGVSARRAMRRSKPGVSECGLDWG